MLEFVLYFCAGVLVAANLGAFGMLFYVMIKGEV